MGVTTGVLPGGYWDPAGVLHREFELSVLTGRDEELLAQTTYDGTATVVTALLSRAVRRLGAIHPVGEDVARELLVADRQYLLLKLRQCTFGDMVRANLFCPWPNCGNRVSMEFKIDDLPVEEPSERAPFYTMTLSLQAADVEPEAPNDESRRQVRFRLPNGADQEALSLLLARNEAEALSLLLARTIQNLGKASSPSVEDVTAMSSMARAEIEAEMERVAPKVELNIETTCPECGRGFLVPFDLQRFFFGELRTDVDLLYRQVHYLAYHYHWAENEIMTMPGSKRQKYVELLAEEIERLNDGA
ncbi:MAG: DUF6760 family protein [Bryobacteraceae bacterium]